jgi:hypothetical protein
MSKGPSDPDFWPVIINPPAQADPMRRCIVCGVECSEREGRVCETCYTPDFVMTILDGDDE